MEQFSYSVKNFFKNLFDNCRRTSNLSTYRKLYNQKLLFSLQNLQLFAGAENILPAKGGYLTSMKACPLHKLAWPPSSLTFIGFKVIYEA